MHLHSDGVVDLDTVPDVLGLTGRRPEAAVVRVLQGRDERSVRALIPDPDSRRDYHGYGGLTRAVRVPGRTFPASAPVASDCTPEYGMAPK